MGTNKYLTNSSNIIDSEFSSLKELSGYVEDYFSDTVENKGFDTDKGGIGVTEFKMYSSKEYFTDTVRKNLEELDDFVDRYVEIGDTGLKVEEVDESSFLLKVTRETESFGYESKISKTDVLVGRNVVIPAGGKSYSQVLKRIDLVEGFGYQEREGDYLFVDENGVSESFSEIKESFYENVLEGSA